MTKLVLVIGFCFFVGESNCQVDSLSFYLNQGDSLSSIKEYDNSFETYTKGLLYCKRDSSWFDWFSAFKKICKLSLVSINGADMLEASCTYLDMVPKDQYSVIGAANDNLGYSYSKLAIVYPAILRFEDAIIAKSVTLDTTRTKSISSIMRTYYNLSRAYSKLGDQESAIKTINIAIDYAEKIDHKDKCKYLIDRGKNYFHNNQNKKAKENFSFAIKACGESSYLYHYMAEVFLEEDSLIKSKFYLDKTANALASGGNYYFENRHKLLFSDFYNKSNQPELAIKMRYKLFDNENVFASQREEIKELVRFARLLFLSQKFEEAIQISQKAISLHFSETDTLNIYSRPIIDESLPDVWIIEALLLKANYFFMKYEKNKKVRDLEESKFYYDYVFSFFDEVKSRYNSSTSKYRMGGYTRDIYSKLIDFNVSSYQNTGERQYFEKAFNLVQSSNAFVLKNAVSERKALKLYGVPQDSISKYLNLKNNVDNIESDSDKNSNDLLELKQFEKTLYTAYPALEKYYSTKANDLIRIQENLGENELLIQYYYQDENLISFEIGKNEVSLTKQNTTESLDSILYNYNNEIVNIEQWDVKTFSDKSSDIYNLVLKKTLEKDAFREVDHLILITDGPLKNLSFSSLVFKPISNELQVEDYLISKYEISYLYYVNQILKHENKTKKKHGFIGFGIEYNEDYLNTVVQDFEDNKRSTNENSLGLQPLEFAAEEVRQIANLLGGDPRLNEEVTLSNVVNSINNYDIVHFSAHAFSNSTSYLDSYIALNRTGEDEKYSLSYNDILNLNLENEFIVLSACQSGSGKNISGEGQMSLSRAFAQSGSKAVMGAYWNAADKSTKDIMVEFYKKLNEGHSKSKALQLAQIEFLTNDELSTPSFRLPYYWSSWALYGSHTAIDRPASIVLYIIAFCGIFLSLLLYFFYRKRVKR